MTTTEITALHSRADIDRAIARIESELSQRYKASRGTDLGAELLALMDVIQATNNLDGNKFAKDPGLAAIRRAYDEFAIRFVVAALAELPDERDYGGERVAYLGSVR